MENMPRGYKFFVIGIILTLVGVFLSPVAFVGLPVLVSGLIIMIKNKEWPEVKKWQQARRELIEQSRAIAATAKRPNHIYCPKCCSTEFQPFKKGFSLGKAAAGGLLLGPVGLLGGMIGANRVELVCLRCGHHWRPRLQP
jgi:tellurium resistance protein TerD